MCVGGPLHEHDVEPAGDRYEVVERPRVSAFAPVAVLERMTTHPDEFARTGRYRRAKLWLGRRVVVVLAWQGWR